MILKVKRCQKSSGANRVACFFWFLAVLPAHLRCEEALRQLPKGPVGLDAEWADSSGTVALLQLATPSTGDRPGGRKFLC